MKRFRFNEESVLKLRQQEKLAAEVVVMQAIRDVREIEAQIEDLQNWLFDAMHGLTTKSAPTEQSNQDTNKWLAIRGIQNGQRHLSQLTEHLVMANERLEQEQRSLREAEIAVKTLEQIKQERLVAHNRIRQSKQQQLSDEATMRMWMNAQQEMTIHD